MSVEFVKSNKRSLIALISRVYVVSFMSRIVLFSLVDLVSKTDFFFFFFKFLLILIVGGDIRRAHRITRTVC